MVSQSQGQGFDGGSMTVVSEVGLQVAHSSARATEHVMFIRCRGLPQATERLVKR